MKNYPNPVEDYTVFEYSVKKRSKVNINIYDPNGKLVEKIEEKIKEPGVYSRMWNLKGGISNGTYYYRLESSSGVSQPEKLIIATN